MVQSSKALSDVWPKRACLLLAGCLVAVCLFPLLGWLLQIPAFITLGSDSAPIQGNTTLIAFLLGAILLAIEVGYRRAAWLSLLPVTIAALTLLQEFTGRSIGIDHLLFDPLPGSDGGLTLPVSTSLLLASLLVTSLVFSRLSQRLTLLFALVASAVVSVGAATLLGYALDLSSVYRWGSGDVTPHFSAWVIVLLGAALLARAWREHTLDESSAPVWLPLPVVVGSATLTVILYLGLEQQEIVRLRDTTWRINNTIITNLEDQISRQATALEDFADGWSNPAKTAVVRGVEAGSYLTDFPAGMAVMLVGTEITHPTREFYPIDGNEHLAGYHHADDPARAAAIARALAPPRQVTVSGTVDILPDNPGYAIYAPIERDGRIWNFLNADFIYSHVLGEIFEATPNLNRDYLAIISISNTTIFDTTGGSPLTDSIITRRGGDDRVIDFRDRRMRFTLVLKEAAFANERRNLPELAGAAGLIVTLLLGVSVHLARTAYTLLRTAELSNRRLVAENEERRRVEAMLKVSDERLRLALDSTQIGIFEWSLPSNQLYYSPGLWAMLDYSPGEIANSPGAWTALIHEDDLPGYREAVERQLAGDETFIDPEYRLRTGKGEWRWIYTRAKTVARASSGTPQRIIGTLQDITERKAAEAALRESQAATRKLSLVAARTDNMVLITSPMGAVEWINESFTRVMEYELDEIRGRTPETFMAGPDTKPRTIRHIRVAMAKGVGVTTEVVNYSKSGRKFHIHLEVQPVRNEQGQVETFIAILADITTRVETEHALRRAKAEADHASRAKSEFLASMSHEIRTPMNGVIGMTSLLMDTKLDPEQRDFVNTIRTSGEALLTIINDILDFSKIESGKMELEHLPFDLTTCVEEALDLFAMQAAAKHLDLAYHVEEDVPGWIMGDITRLRQVLVNLVNNAVKFTASGAITITVRRKHLSVVPGGQDRIMLEVTVQDTGIGIPSERVNRLFKPFSQIDSSTTRKYGGTGLGLAICHRLTQLMGGNIHVESTQGEGSRFIFTLRTEAAHPINIEALPAAPTSLKKHPVLGIEDNAVGQQRLSTFFQQWKIDYLPATDATAAVAAAHAPEAPGLVLLDDDVLESPTAPDLLQAINRRSLPTLLLLTPGRPVPDELSAKPYVLSLKKPLKTSTLLRGVHTLFRATDQSLPPIEAPAKRRILAEEFPLDVLLVEDNMVNQKVALRFLDRLGYRADCVGNGLEAVQALEDRDFDLVLMDLQMPEMDGFEASREIRRKFPRERQPKIVALTANALQGDRDVCLEAGMDDYITKPVKLHELSEVIRRQFTAHSEESELPTA
ncbi:ATP-binding protein [Actomonas aquatica]|uniref:histidine kinase n=1 Tax=Actomonas aquatica TaxID=2866162 RepID=A0ABZ1C5T1_9BACT|nr:ATP-binding protein [Opitutus sp. WL0086]WRQ87086.1 ATP-binding protein [Opitutus sp. WL0086]